jgi:hypothetical protein
MEKALDVQRFRAMIVKAEEKMKNAGALTGEALEEQLPLKHSFGKDLYIREIFAPTGALIITKIHKYDHPYFIMRGKVSVLTEDGVITLEAPYQGITKAGTKRAVYVHEDVTWTTVHATKETDLDKIEEEIIAKDYTELEGVIPCRL